MKLNFFVFELHVNSSMDSFDISFKKVGYDICVQQSPEDGFFDDPIQSWYKARTFRGAQLKGWLQARRYAKEMGCDQDVLIYHDIFLYEGSDSDFVW
jgi:hypothetical protein